MVEDFLEKTPQFRERKFKDRGIVHILLHQRTGGISPLTKDELVGFVRDYASADRAWRQILEKRVDLRGNDYYQKNDKMRGKQRELGYDR